MVFPQPPEHDLTHEASGWTRGSLLELSAAYWQSCTLHAAVVLDIVTVLDTRSMTAAALAAKLRTDLRGTEVLLDALSALGLLTKQDASYTATSAAFRLLHRDSPDYLGHIIRHHHHLVDGWAQLDQAVTSGKPVAMRSHGTEQERESFQLGMCNLAMGIAPQMASQLDLAGFHHLLDLGGGPGTYAIHFCLANPQLRATVFDRPTSREYALATAADFQVADRLAFVAGDFTADPLPGEYDVAWLSHILHSYPPETCEAILIKTLAAMQPGGLIIIHEFFLNHAKDGPLFPALFSLNMLLNNQGGRSYTVQEISAMLTRHGVGKIRLLDFRGPNDSGVLCGTV